jgi:histidinol-phosphate phosphatase family protein
MFFSQEHSYKNWTLFLDRDGVINVRPFNSYVKNPIDFQFITGAKEAISILCNYFKYVIIVTNQQGVGKGLMTENDLKNIHKHMIHEIEICGGRVDAVYYCTMLSSEENNCRKPSPSMAYQAKQDFSDIDFELSVMVGDTSSDIAFGKNLGMKTIQIGNETTDIQADLKFNDLKSFAKSIELKQP